MILGDSQIMSGVNPILLKEHLEKKGKSSDILYYPRPSEQPEGIYILLKNFIQSKITSKVLLVNISPITTSKNNWSDSNRRLFQNFSPFTSSIFLDPALNKFYLKNLSGNIYYLLLQPFPLLKLNGNFSKEIKLIPDSDGIVYGSNIESYLRVNIFGNLKLNYSQNTFLDSHLEKQNYYFEWGNFSEFTGECVKREEPLFLPSGIEPTFQTFRKESLETWIKIGNLAKENNTKIYFLYIPFAKEAEIKIGSNLLTSPIQISLAKISETFGESSLIQFDSSLFESGDFRDYTHLNICGMMKLTKELAHRL